MNLKHIQGQLAGFTWGDLPYQEAYSDQAIICDEAIHDVDKIIQEARQLKRALAKRAKECRSIDAFNAAQILRACTIG